MWINCRVARWLIVFLGGFVCDPLIRPGLVTKFRCNRFWLGVDWYHDLRFDSLHPYYIPVCGALEAGEPGSRARRDERW